MFQTYFDKLFFWLNRSHENPTSGELRLRKSQKGDHMTHLGHQGWWNSLHPPPPLPSPGIAAHHTGQDSPMHQPTTNTKYSGGQGDENFNVESFKKDHLKSF